MYFHEGQVHLNVNVARTLTDAAPINALGGRINIGRSAYRRLYFVACNKS